MEEIRKLFEEHGAVLRVLMPPSGTIAIVQFTEPGNARIALSRLAYRRIGESMLYLEPAPENIFQGIPNKEKQPTSDVLEGEGEPEDATSLFVRGLPFSTTTSGLAETFKPLDGFVSAVVKTKSDPKKPGQVLSMGFGFVEFRTKEQAQAALKVIDGYKLDGFTLSCKLSHKGQQSAEEKARKSAGQRTKIIVKNLSFEVNKKDIRTLFSTYGQLRAVRVPKKFDHSSRGFAFVDFTTAREAENAFNALKDSHLLGRKLVLEFAEAEAIDAEEEIAKMQKKVGGQVNKVALQQLTGGGRKRFKMGDEDDDEA
jgi:multiple RNA-binding domain-containing protein 1